MYPEFKDISDEDLREGFRRKFYPTMKFDKVTDYLPDETKKKTSYTDFEVIELILKRGDAVLGSGNWKGAAKEYSRVSPVDPKYTSFDRWKVVNTIDNNQYLIDFQTFSPIQHNLISFWVRKMDTNTQYYSQAEYLINCANKTISIGSTKNYDSDGHILGTSKKKPAFNIEPESLEEFFYNGACGISQKY